MQDTYNDDDFFGDTTEEGMNEHSFQNEFEKNKKLAFRDRLLELEGVEDLSGFDGFGKWFNIGIQKGKEKGIIEAKVE